MADTGFKAPTTNGAKFTDWTNPGNAYVSDNVYADSLSTGNFQSWETHSFGIPAGAVINGIEITIEAKTQTAARDWQVGVWSNSASNWGDKTVNVGTVESVKTLGGAADLWGLTWTASDFSNANFSERVVMNLSNQHFLDQILTKVYYTPALSNGNFLAVF